MVRILRQGSQHFAFLPVTYGLGPFIAVDRRVREEEFPGQQKSDFQLKGETHMSTRASYWKANLRLVTICLVIWFLVSFVFGILLAEPLNAIRIGGYKLGFWFAQQGSIYTFVALVFFYAWRVNKLDQKFGVHED